MSNRHPNGATEKLMSNRFSGKSLRVCTITLCDQSGSGRIGGISIESPGAYPGFIWRDVHLPGEASIGSDH